MNVTQLVNTVEYFWYRVCIEHGMPFQTLSKFTYFSIIIEVTKGSSKIVL